jgi:hypothetical protein
MSAHKDSMALATATLMDIISKGKAIQAAAVRDAAPADRESIRNDAHSLLDAYLDQMAAAGVQVRAILEG